MINNFNGFLNENVIESAFKIDEFIKSIEEEMAWNSTMHRVEVELIDADKKLIERDKTPKEIFPKCNIFFLYTGAPGQSVRKDVLEACKNLSYTTAKVAVIANYSRHEQHEYLIGLSVSPSVATSIKYGI